MTLVGRFGSTAIGLLSIIVLSRLLAPSDFGIVAMATAFVALGEIIRDSGLTSAAIQAKSLTRAQRDNLWWLSTGLGITVGVVFAAFSPVIAWFFGEPMVKWVCLALSLTFMMNGATTQHRAILARSLKFTATSIADIASAVAGLIAAVVAALLGAGLWALVIQSLTSGLISMISVIAIGGWVPRRYSRAAPMRSLLGFGIPMFATAVVQYAAANLDSIILGRMLGPEVLGTYNRAVRISRQPLNAIRGPLGVVALSTLSKQQHDVRLIAKYARVGQTLLGYPLLFIAGFIALFAPEVTYLFLGEGWENAAVYVSLIVVGEGLNTLSSTGGWVYSAMGRTRKLLGYTVFSAGVRIALLVSLGVPFGAIGVACACAVSPLVLWPISLLWAGRATGVDMRPLLVNSFRIFAVSAFAFGPAALTLQSVDWGSTARIASGVALVLCGLLVCALVPAVRRDAKDLSRVLRLAIDSRAARPE